MSGDILLELRSEWSSISRSPESRSALVRLDAAAVRERDPGMIPWGVKDLGDLVLAMSVGGSLEQLRKHRIIALLLIEADDPMLARCLLQTLLSGLVSLSRRLEWGDEPGLLSDAISECSVVISDWTGRRRQYATGDLLNAVRCRVRRRLAREWKTRRILSSYGLRPLELIEELA
jgi:hypothetical protein